MRATSDAAEMQIKRFDGGRFFAGANSKNGFISYYDSILDDRKIEKIYILKGGPGTGKSSFMKKAAECAKKMGMSVEEYICSSDPDSLDGVVIGERFAIIDGTAPHSVDPRIAGAREEIINLGSFWDDSLLEKSAAEIETLGKSKSECYKKAYRYLSAYQNVVELNSSLVEPYFNGKKAKKAADRLFSRLKKGGGYGNITGIASSVGMKGRVRCATYEKFADRIYIIDDHFGCAHKFLGYLIECARLTDTPIRVSFDPVSASSADAVYFYNDRTAFVTKKDRSQPDVPDSVKINMRRFVEHSHMGNVKSEYRLNAKLAEALMESALEALRAAGEYHFALEKIYVSCMDFAAEDVFCRNFLENVFGKYK